MPFQNTYIKQLFASCNTLHDWLFTLFFASREEDGERVDVNELAALLHRTLEERCVFPRGPTLADTADSGLCVLRYADMVMRSPGYIRGALETMSGINDRSIGIQSFWQWGKIATAREELRIVLEGLALEQQREDAEDAMAVI